MGISPYAILGGILQGVGTAGSATAAAMEQQRKEAMDRERLAQEMAMRQQAADIQREQLAQQQSQFDATQAANVAARSIPLPPELGGGTTLKELLPFLFEQAKAKDERARLGEAATFVRNSAGQPAQLTGQDAALAPGEDPEAAAFLPMAPGRAAMTPEELVAGLIQRGNKPDGIASLMKILRPDTEEKPQLVSDTTRGYLTRSGQFTELPQPQGAAGLTEPPAARPGYEVVTTWDKTGRPTYREERISTGVDRDALAQAQGYASFAAAPQDVQKAINAQIRADRRGDLANQGVEAAKLNAKPPTEDEAKALAANTASLAAVNTIKGFSADEISKYVGLLNRPLSEAQQTLAGLGLGPADRRFVEFKSTVGRMQQAMFDTAGKALTDVEKRVVSSFIPTGDERNAAEFMSKVRSFEAYTKAAREIRLDLSRTGRGSIDPAEYDRRLAGALGSAGIAGPTQAAPGWDQSAGGGQGTRVRDPKTGRTGTVPPGQPIPPGVEVIR